MQQTGENEALPESPTRTVSNGVDERIVCYHDPDHSAVGCFRRFREQITAGVDGEHKVLMFTSALPGEGKSATLVNLAVVTCRELGLRIVIVDCDLRRPGTHKLVGVRDKPGLADVLNGDEQLAKSLLVDTPVAGLTLLPAGTQQHGAAEILRKPKSDEVLAWLRTEFDLVLLDAPPVFPHRKAAMASPDAGDLGPKADGVILVVQAWKTPRERVNEAVEKLHGSNVLGFVLNRVSAKE